MIIELDYSGHYPRKQIEVTDEEYQRIRTLENGGKRYLFDTPEGQQLIGELELRPSLKKPPVVLVYC